MRGCGAGSNYGNGGVASDMPSHGQGCSVALNLPPLGYCVAQPSLTYLPRQPDEQYEAASDDAIVAISLTKFFI